MSRIRLVALPRAVVGRAGLLRFRGSGMQVSGFSFQAWSGSEQPFGLTLDDVRDFGERFAAFIVVLD